LNHWTHKLDDCVLGTFVGVLCTLSPFFPTWREIGQSGCEYWIWIAWRQSGVYDQLRRYRHGTRI